MQSNLVFIYAIPRPSALGLHTHINEASNKPIGKTKFGRATDRIRALYSERVGGLATGLHKPYLDDQGLPMKDPVTGRELTLQDKMERKWNKPEGYFHNRPWLKGDSARDEDASYFQKASWQLSESATVLDLSKMDDELGYYVFLDSPLVANSEREWKEHKWPKAQYYIALYNESEEIKYTRNQIRSKAYANLHDSAFTPSYKRKFVTLLGLSKPSTELTDEAVHNLLFDFIDKSTMSVNSNIDKFNRYFLKLSTPTGKSAIEAEFLLLRAVEKRVIFEKQGAYTWIRQEGNIVIGETLTEAVDYILDPKKADLIKELEKQLK